MTQDTCYVCRIYFRTYKIIKTINWSLQYFKHKDDHRLTRYTVSDILNRRICFISINVKMF